jgi:hypothetical protein
LILELVADKLVDLFCHKVFGTTIMSVVGSFVEIDGLRAIISDISSDVTDNTIVLKYIMIDVAEADVKDVILNNIKFDMFKWFHPTKVDYVRDRLTFYGFKEDKNMYMLLLERMSRYNLCTQKPYQKHTMV